MPEINLERLDATLLAEIDQQLRDGKMTQTEADRLRTAIQGGASKRLADFLLGDHTK